MSESIIRAITMLQDYKGALASQNFADNDEGDYWQRVNENKRASVHAAIEGLRTELAALNAQEPSVADWPEIGLPPAGSVCEARIPHHTSEGRQMIWTEVEVLAHALVEGVPYSWVKETGSAGSLYAPMMLSFRCCAGRNPTVKQSLTVAKDQHARDSAELRRLCAERDKLKAELAALNSAPVVMPNQMVVDGRYGKDHMYSEGWNDALLEVIDLNRSKT